MDGEIIAKLNSLPHETRKKVIDGLVKMLATRPKDCFNGFECEGYTDDNENMNRGNESG
jgi:hypothetical protein